MKKRKLDINQIKKATLRGRQARSITTKYEVVLGFFKKKDSQASPIFTVYLDQLVADLLDQLSSAEITYKLQNELKGELNPVSVGADSLEFNVGCLAHICKQFPIKEIMDCIEIRKDDLTKKVTICVVNAKLMVFFKHLRAIFPEFCYSTGEKTIIDSNDLRAFYETFKCEWNKIHERGRMDNCEKLEKLLCRSLYFLGALIENNIFNEIAEEERLKREEKADISTKSEKKSKLKLLTHQVSSTYSFGGEVDLMSNLSSGMMSQKSNQESFCKTGGFSEKSERPPRKERGCRLWELAEVKEMKIGLSADNTEKPGQSFSFEIDLLSNDVENILIEQAFKIQKLKDESSRFGVVGNGHYSYSQYTPGYYHEQYYMNYYSPLIYTQPPSTPQVNRMGSHTNLVSTRKTHSRLENKKDYP